MVMCFGFPGHPSLAWGSGRWVGQRGPVRTEPVSQGPQTALLHFTSSACSSSSQALPPRGLSISLVRHPHSAKRLQPEEVPWTAVVFRPRRGSRDPDPRAGSLASEDSPGGPSNRPAPLASSLPAAVQLLGCALRVCVCV